MRPYITFGRIDFYFRVFLLYKWSENVADCPISNDLSTIHSSSTSCPLLLFWIVYKLCTTSLLLLCNVRDLVFFERRKAGFFPTMKFQLSQLP